MSKSLLLKALIVSITLIANLCVSEAQDNSNKGTDFWIGYMDHIGNDNSEMQLYITSDSNTTGTVSIPGESWSVNFSVTANSMTLVKVPTNKARMECSDCIQKRGINVSSKLPVVVYSHIYYQNKSDATLALPTTTAGKEYYVMSYKLIQQRKTFGGMEKEHNQFMIIASQDSTKINITPTEDIEKSSGVHQKGKTYSITLNKGESYQGKAVLNGSYDDTEIIGTHIQVIDTGKSANCRTVAVFAGSSNAIVGCTDNRASGDNLYQQMFPVSSYGTKFIVVPFKDRNGDLVRVMAAENSTVVRVGSQNHNLQAGEFVEASVSGTPLYIRSNKPLMVAQFQKSQSRCNGGTGDPSMTILTPIEQTLEDIVLFSSKDEDITKFYINVVIPTTGTSKFRLDGNTVNFSQVPTYPAYSYAQITVTTGNHRLTAEDGFNATAYGFGNYESYGYAAGANIKNRSVYIDLANSNYESDLGICLGEQVKFEGKSGTNVITKWEWDFGDGNQDTIQNPKHDYNKPGEYKVVVKAYKKTSNGCATFDSSILYLSIFATPKADFSYTVGCEGDAVVFSDSTKIDSGYFIENNIWDLGGPPYKFGQLVSKTFQDTGFYTITNEAVSKNKCRNKVSKQIYINPKPKVKFGFDNLCSGQQTSFHDSTTVSIGTLAEWKWKFNNGIDSSSLQNPSYTFSSFGSNTVDLAVTSDSGCVNSWDTTVTILDSIKANFTVQDTCLNKAFVFKNTSHEGSSSLTYSWNFGDDSTSTLSNPTHNYLVSKSHTVRLIASQNDECFDTMTRDVSVYPLAQGAIKYNDACLGDSTTLYNEYSINNGQVTKFAWRLNGSITKTDSAFKHKFINQGKQSLILNYTSDKGCESSVNDSLYINPLPVAKLWTNGINELCFGESLRLVDSSSTLDSIVLSRIQFLNNTSNTKEYNYTTDSTGNRVFFIHVTSKYGCVDSSTKTIVVNSGPVVDFTLADICQDLSQTANNLTTLESGNIVSWKWFDGINQVSTAKSPSLSFNQDGLKQIKLIAESNNGCKDSMTKPLNIWDKPIATFQFDTACRGEQTNFISFTSINSGSIATNQWDFGDGTNGNGTNTNKVYGNSGNFQVTLIATSDKMCSDTVANTILVGEIPTVDFNSDLQIGCIPQLINFTDLSSITNGNLVDWTWDFGNLNGSNIQNPQNIYSLAGKYSVSLKVESDLGCTNSISKADYIEIFNLPTASFTMNPDTPTFLNPDVSFIDNSVGNGISAWDWDFGNGDIDNIQNPFYSFKDTGLYYISLVVTDINGCKDTAINSVFLTPILKFYMPNSFFPNDNGRNDVFKPGGIFQGINNYSISIYNRWGERLYTSTDPEEGWDGSFGGKNAPIGVYIYKIRYTDYTRSKWFDLSGEFTLFR